MSNTLTSILFLGGFAGFTHGLAQAISTNIYYILPGLLAMFVSLAIVGDEKGR